MAMFRLRAVWTAALMVVALLAYAPASRPSSTRGTVRTASKDEAKPATKPDGNAAGAEPAAPAKPKRDLPGPRPEYKPEQVVQIVMDALRDNGADDDGIAVTFNFASPGNQAATGPLERFATMVRGPAYRPMINCKAVDYGEPAVEDGQFVQLVVVTDADGNRAWYLFQLSKQADGKFKDCWMTDGVVRVEPKKGAQQTSAKLNA